MDGNMTHYPVPFSSPDVTTIPTIKENNSSNEADFRELNYMVRIVVPVTLYGACAVCIGFLLSYRNLSSPTTTVNVLVGAILGMWLAARVFWRVTSLMQNPYAKFMFSEEDNAPKVQNANDVHDCQVTGSSLSGHIMVYTMLADFVFLPLALALSVFRETSSFSILGSFMLPPFDVPYNTSFYALFFSFPG